MSNTTQRTQSPQSPQQMKLCDAQAVMKLNNSITQNRVQKDEVVKLTRVLNFFQQQQQAQQLGQQNQKKTRKHKLVKSCLRRRNPTLELRKQDLVAIPDARECTHVRQVYLSGNKFSSFPDWFTETFSNIKLLDLSNNGFRALPNDFDKLQHLEVINLAGNNFEFFPAVLLKLPKLKKVDISRNTLMSVPNDIHRMTSLVELDLSSNQLMSLPEDFARMKNLKKIRIHSNPFLASECDNIQRLTAQMQKMEEKEREKQEQLDQQYITQTPLQDSPILVASNQRRHSLTEGNNSVLITTAISEEEDDDDDADYYYEPDEPEDANGIDDQPHVQNTMPTQVEPQQPSNPEELEIKFVRVLMNESLFRGSFKSHCMKENAHAKRCIDFWEQINLKFLTEKNEDARSKYGYKLFAHFFDNNEPNTLKLQEDVFTKLQNDIADYIELNKQLLTTVFQDAIREIEHQLIPASKIYKVSTAFALVSLKTQMVLNQYDVAKSPNHHTQSVLRTMSEGCEQPKTRKKRCKREFTSFPSADVLEEKKKQEQKQIEKMTKDRCNALMEILESERKYVAFMNTLWTVYYEPLMDAENSENKLSNLLPLGSVSKIFPPNLEGIFGLNRSLLNELETRFAMYSTEESQDTIYFSIVGDIFVKFAPKFKVYSGYAVAYENCTSTIRNFKKKYQAFEEWLEEKKISEESGGYDLGALLIMPIQRVPRYLLLMKTLLSTTEQDHADYNYLIEASDLLAEYATLQNEKIRETNSISKVSQLAKSLKLPLLADGKRKLLHEGNITRLPKNKLVSAYLFDDLLVLHQTKGSGLFKRNVITQIDLTNSVLTGGGSNTFSLFIPAKQEKLDFKCADNNEKIRWVGFLTQSTLSDESVNLLVNKSRTADFPKQKSAPELGKPDTENASPLPRRDLDNSRNRRKSLAITLGEGFKKALGHLTKM